MANYQSNYTGAYIDGVMAQKRSAGYFPTYEGTTGVGNDTHGIYINSSGIVEASTKTLVTQNSTTQVGNAYTPVYINSSGQPVACTVMPFGSSTKPNTARLATIYSDGVMEVGQYLDFHNDAETSSDYTYRINNNANNLLTFSGELNVQGPYFRVYSTTQEAVCVYGDNEGGNVRFYPPSTYNSYWEMDAYNNDFRIYALNTTGDQNYKSFVYGRNGNFISPNGMGVQANTASSWIDGTNDWTANPWRSAINIVNAPTDGSFYPWMRQRAGNYYYTFGVLPNQTSFYIYNNVYNQTNNYWGGMIQMHAYARTFSRVQKAAYNVEAQIGVEGPSGIIYMYSQANSANRGIYTTGGPGYNGALLTVNSAGVITHHTSDRRVKIDKGYLEAQEAKTILSELPVINFTYVEDVNYNNLEQSGIYAQDLRDILLRHNYKNRGYLQTYLFEDDYDGEEAEQKPNIYFDEKIHKKGNVSSSYTFDITPPEEEVRLYQMNYEALIPLLLKGWQIHEQKIQELEARIQELENMN